MISVCSHEENQHLIKRIQQLHPHSKALWGTMTVTQMLAHCRKPLQFANGEMEMRKRLLYTIFGGIAKKIFVNPKPFLKNMPTDKCLIITNHDTFANEQQELLTLLARFAQQGHSIFTTKPHPIFGTMTPDEWDMLQWKHLDHHLRQFGV